GLLFGALAVAAVALGRKGRLEHLGWLGPAVALLATGVLVGVGRVSRAAVTPTVAGAQIVEGIPGRGGGEANGFLAVYQPSASNTLLGAEQGGQFEFDRSDLEGRVHRRVQTDLDRWHWENLGLPAGVQLAPFQYTLRTPNPVEATVRFGPE